MKIQAISERDASMVNSFFFFNRNRLCMNDISPAGAQRSREGILNRVSGGTFTPRQSKI